MGVVLGVSNGLLINGLRINSFVATLATMFAFRGIAWKLVGASDKPFTDSPALFLGRTFLGLGLPVYLMIAIVAGLVLNRTPVGRYLYAVGGSQRSAVETGLPVNRIRLVAYRSVRPVRRHGRADHRRRVGTLQAGLGVGLSSP